MPLTNDDLQNFYQFALGAIKTDDNAASLRELADKWDAQRERTSANESIRQSLAEFEAGQGEPVRDFLGRMKSKYNLTLDSNS